MKYEVCDIEWELDGYEGDPPDLPTKVVLELDNANATSEDIAEALSEETGFVTGGFTYAKLY